MDGRLFHTCAVVTPKARLPMVQSRVCGTISHCVEPDCSRWRDSNSSVHRKSLTRYRSAFEFWRKRKRSTESRNWMCSGTRSHWRSRSSCVTWSWFSFYNKTVRDVINMVIFKQKCFSFWGTKSIKRFIPVPIGDFRAYSIQLLLFLTIFQCHVVY